MASEDDVDPNAWLNTYADMVTLLLTFFVLLLSMSTVDAEKWELVVQAISGKQTNQLSNVVIQTIDEILDEGYPMSTTIVENPTETGSGAVELPSEFDDIYLYLKTYLESDEAEGVSDSVELVGGEGKVFIRFNDNLFFDPDKSDIKSEEKELLDVICGALAGVEDEIRSLTVEGHTAAIPENENYPVSDRLLSSARADNIVIYMDDLGIVSSDKMSAIGWGKYHPVADNNTPEGRSRNRRVEILIQQIGAPFTSMQEIYALLDTGALSSNANNNENPPSDNIADTIPNEDSPTDVNGDEAPPIVEPTDPIEPDELSPDDIIENMN